jgi:hypothetical protein
MQLQVALLKLNVSWVGLKQTSNLQCQSFPIVSWSVDYYCVSKSRSDSQGQTDGIDKANLVVIFLNCVRTDHAIDFNSLLDR